MVRSGQINHATLSESENRYTYNIQHVIQKLPTKCHVNWAIEPGVLTVDAQIVSWHLIIFAIYLHIETGISKSFKVPVFLFGHSIVIFYP